MFTAIAAGSSFAAHEHWDGPGHWWPIFPILWFLAIFTAIFLFGRRARHCRYASRSGVARLSERYAAGEIDEAEYRERRAVLEESRR